MSAEVLASPPPGRPEWVVTTKSCWLELGATTNFSHVHGVEANAVRQAVGDSLRRLQLAVLRRLTGAGALTAMSDSDKQPVD